MGLMTDGLSRCSRYVMVEAPNERERMLTRAERRGVVELDECELAGTHTSFVPSFFSFGFISFSR